MKVTCSYLARTRLGNTQRERLPKDEAWENAGNEAGNWEAMAAINSRADGDVSPWVQLSWWGCGRVSYGGPRMEVVEFLNHFLTSLPCY